MMIKRKELLELIRENDVVNVLKRGPIALFWMPDEKRNNKNKPREAVSITFTIWKSLLIAKSNKSIIPVHIYTLKEIKNENMAVRK